MYVLGGPPASEDPAKAQFKIVGPVRNMPDQWAIDGTIIHLMGSMYMVYSSWPTDEGAKHRYGNGKNVQEIHIVKLGAPDEAVSAPTLICWPDQKWEWSGNAGINEGPQWLAAPDGSWVGIAYSCAGSWTRDYKMNTIQFVGNDPLDPRSWRKSREPLLQSLDKPPFGPGHGSFIEMQGDFVGIFHGTDNATDGWGNRKARCQRVHWTSHGPHMGKYCGPLTTDLDVFRGIKQPPGHYNHHGGMEGFLQKASAKLSQKLREL
jgi:GH43 family beta-xylosidase